MGIFLVMDTPWSHAARIREILLYGENQSKGPLTPPGSATLGLVL